MPEKKEQVEAHYHVTSNLEEGDIELAGNAGGGRNFVLPGAVRDEASRAQIGDHLFGCEEAKTHYERTLHLSSSMQAIGCACIYSSLGDSTGSTSDARFTEFSIRKF